MDKINFDEIVVGMGTGGNKTKKIVNWSFEEVDCGKLYVAKQWDYKGRPLSRNLKMGAVFHTSDGGIYHTYFSNSGKIIEEVIYKELELNIKNQIENYCAHGD